MKASDLEDAGFSDDRGGTEQPATNEALSEALAAFQSQEPTPEMRAIVNDMTKQKETVNLPNLIERAQMELNACLSEAESDRLMYENRVHEIDEQIEFVGKDIDEADRQVRYWQAVGQNAVALREALNKRKTGPQAALDALRKAGV